MDELKEKIARLPAWVREYIKRLEIRAEPRDKEVLEARISQRKAEKQRDEFKVRYDTIKELLNCAANGGHETAKEAVRAIIEEFKPDEDEG